MIVTSQTASSQSCEIYGDCSNKYASGFAASGHGGAGRNITQNWRKGI